MIIIKGQHIIQTEFGLSSLLVCKSDSDIPAECDRTKTASHLIVPQSTPDLK